MVKQQLIGTMLLYGIIIAMFCVCESQQEETAQPSDKLTSSNMNYPEQIHLSLGSFPNDIIVMWSTKADEKGYVEFGGDSNLFRRILGATVELKVHSEQAARFLHRAELLALTPGKQYSYNIVSGNSQARSQNLTFVVPHNDRKKQHSFMVLADMGLATKSLQFIVHEVLRGGYETVFHIGDFAYNLHSYGGSSGDRYMNRVDNFTARVPYMTTPGDHESITEPGDDKEESYYHYRYRFSMPKAHWPMPLDSLWYSIDIGFTHFVSINTDLFMTQSSLNLLQLKWLKKDLATANEKREKHPWIIVMGHKPMYCTKSVMIEDCHKDHSAMRDQLEDLFYEQGVDLYFSGHKHCYERSWPMYLGRTFQTNTINPMAPIYIIIGATGYEYLVDQQLSHPYWLAFASADRSKELYGKLNVWNESHLEWSVHSALHAEEVENVIIIQNHHGSFGKSGSSAFDKISKHTSNLPPEPLNIVDEPFDYNFRRTYLYLMVFMLSFILFIFLRNARVKKALREWF